jgi:hypothetical protein
MQVWIRIDEEQMWEMRWETGACTYTNSRAVADKLQQLFHPMPPSKYYLWYFKGSLVVSDKPVEGAPFAAPMFTVDPLIFDNFSDLYYAARRYCQMMETSP